jgi:hypothetical protein
MSNKPHSHKKGRRGGCLLAIVTVVFLLFSGIYFVLAPVRESKRVEQSLIDRFGPAGQYTPASNGSVLPERVELFIRVREAMQPNCADYQAILDNLMGLEALDSDQQIPGDERVSKGINGFISLFSAAPVMVEFMDARNTSLLTQEMGLGEYLYIYLTAYAGQLANESVSPYSEMDEAYISQRIRDDFVQILNNQLTALEAAGQRGSMEGLMLELRGEIKALQDGSHESPWPNGSPGTSLESLAPYRARLSDLYCSGIVRIELLQKNRGLDLRG